MLGGNKDAWERVGPSTHYYIERPIGHDVKNGWHWYIWYHLMSERRAIGEFKLIHMEKEKRKKEKRLKKKGKGMNFLP